MAAAGAIDLYKFALPEILDPRQVHGHHSDLRSRNVLGIAADLVNGDDARTFSRRVTPASGSGVYAALSAASASRSNSRAKSISRALMPRVVTPSAARRASAGFRRAIIARRPAYAFVRSGP